MRAIIWLFLASVSFCGFAAAQTSTFPQIMDPPRTPGQGPFTGKDLHCDELPPATAERPTQVAPLAPDLAWSGGAALSRMVIHLPEEGEGTLTLEVVAELLNAGRCDAGESRMKAILSFAGGRWLGEFREDVAVPRRGRHVFSASFTLPLQEVAVAGCHLNRDDWVVKFSADHREIIEESQEDNNQYVYEFSTASDNFCPADSDPARKLKKADKLKKPGRLKKTP